MQQPGYYIGSITGTSGICKYTKDFHDDILSKQGYLFVDSATSPHEILARIDKSDRVHMEIGIFQKKEISILMLLLNAGYKKISITLHDPPLFKYPFFESSNTFFNNLSKFYDRWIDGFRHSRKYLARIKTIYVLTHKGTDAVRKRYKLGNVFYLPHVVRAPAFAARGCSGNNLLYVGFIGKNKGIGYALQLHEALLRLYPDCIFYVAGTAMGTQKKYLTTLQSAYRKNVQFLGYVPEEKMPSLFSKACFSMILFEPYRFFYPASGSLLYNLAKGNIVFTSDVNTTSELVTDGENGFFLTGVLHNDIAIVSVVFENKVLQEAVRKKSLERLTEHHSAAAVANYWMDKEKFHPETEYSS